jgi:IS5 family transposase
MIRTTSQYQLDLAGFESPFETALRPDDRWVTLSHIIPWDELADAYYQSLSVTKGRAAKDGRCRHYQAQAMSE